jgi:hypothetical protein
MARANQTTRRIHPTKLRADLIKRPSVAGFESFSAVKRRVTRTKPRAIRAFIAFFSMT